jgi:hypothetical protein
MAVIQFPFHVSDTAEKMKITQINQKNNKKKILHDDQHSGLFLKDDL